MMTHATKKALLFLAPLVLAACVGDVEDHRAGTDGNNLNGNGGADGGGDATPLMAVAMTRAQQDVLWDAYWQNQDSGSTVAAGGGGLDPEDLFIHISGQENATCGAPFVELSCGEEWSVSLGLPRDAQHVGTYDLQGPLLSQFSHMSETGAPHGNDPDDCSWGGGSLGDGTLEVIAIDAQSIHIKLQANGGYWSHDPSGEYIVPLCR